MKTFKKMGFGATSLQGLERPSGTELSEVL